MTPVVIIITFAGHGSRDHRLIAFDTRFDSWDAEIPMAELAQRFRGSDAKAVICIPASPCTALFSS